MLQPRQQPQAGASHSHVALHVLRSLPGTHIPGDIRKGFKLKLEWEFTQKTARPRSDQIQMGLIHQNRSRTPSSLMIDSLLRRNHFQDPLKP